MKILNNLTQWTLCLAILAACWNFDSTTKDNQPIAQWSQAQASGTDQDVLVRYISKAFGKSTDLVRQVVKEAFTQAKPNAFPTPVDVLAVMAVESRFNPVAKSEDGKNSGLMQINEVHKLRQPTNVKINVKKGTDLLKEYHAQFRTTKGALIAYNQGPGSALVLCKPRVSNSECNTQYTDKVLAVKRRLVAVLRRA